MAGAILEKRELYIDVAVKETLVEEIFLYQVDFFRDQTFRTKEHVYKREEIEGQSEEEPMEDSELPPEPLELFKEQWEALCREEVPTEVYATEAMTVMNYIFEPLMKKGSGFQAVPELRAGREFLHDCVSMGRVVSMSSFDEEQYLSAGIRRRMKERYHDFVDEIKTEYSGHIFIRQTEVDDVAVMLLCITDAEYKIKKQVMLHRAMKEETLAIRFREILSLYPEADIFVDTATPELYRLFHNMNQFMGMQEKRRIFSMESMLSALGKAPEYTDIVKTYLLYIKNHEELRYGNFLPERLYSLHSFYLPVLVSGEKEWNRCFENNSVWKPEGKDGYCIEMTGERKGKFIVRSGKEQFGLKVRNISLQRYLKKYAVIRLDVENFCYPGKDDKARINELAAWLFSGMEQGGADSMVLKLKDKEQSYSLAAIPKKGNEGELWLNGLLTLGQKKKQGKKGLVLAAMRELMYCVETRETEEEEQIIQVSLVRDGVFRRIEDALAKAMRTERAEYSMGSLDKHQKRRVKELFGIYRYMVVSFGEIYEGTQQAKQKKLFVETAEALGTTEVMERLKNKFGLFF